MKDNSTDFRMYFVLYTENQVELYVISIDLEDQLTKNGLII